jgi:dolichol-phosphate mannosyltransferase
MTEDVVAISSNGHSGGHPHVGATNGNGSNGRGPVRPGPVLSVIVPTRNEAGNVGRLLDALETALPYGSEIIFVDDSTDETPALIEAERGRRSTQITLIHRPEHDRGDGLAGAVVRGLGAAAAPWVCVMDADLQHPPELVARMLDRAQAGVDMVVASRYCDRGSSNFGAARAFLSRASTRAAQLLFPRSLRGVSDPMSGFFLVRRAAVAIDRLRPRGFKILLEILVRSRELRVAEVPFEFGVRYAGESKASLGEGGRYLLQLAALRFGGNLVRFLAVGVTGLGVNSAAFLFFTSVAHVHYLLAAVISTQFSTAWNFALVERLVFGHRRRRMRSGAARFSTFLALNNLSLLLRGPALYVLVSLVAMNSAVANLLSLLAIFVARFVVADRLIWGNADAGNGPQLYWYRIHDEVTVESPVRLRELERFRIDDPIQRPTIRVRLGRLNRKQSDLVSGLTSPSRHIRYDEGLGWLGFAVDIAWGEHVDIVASPLLRLSPHVLYTNVVEPTLRWCFVKRGYALAHAACIASNGHAHLITARTDTGKTTTILKILDRHPASFLSDDLTLIAPDGRVLMYPKPLTISRHTVASVKTPLLTRRERLALILQSRVHSRSGRQFAQLIARLRLPAATINAIVQLVVPPPKYHVDRLVPGVDLASEARIAGFVVIERGGTGEVQLAHEEAMEVLVANSEDAYGFPPYPALEHFMHSGNGHDLRLEERRIIASALAEVEAVVLRSETMDWAQRVAALAGLGEPKRVPVASHPTVIEAVVPLTAE